jgi:cytidylate kinase
MNTTFGLDRCFTFVNCQLQPTTKTGTSYETPAQKCAITISRQSGCGGHAIAEKLCAHLQMHSPKDAPPWTLFDRNLVEKVLQDHNLPERLAHYMPEDRVPELNDIMDELFGLHPSMWTLTEKAAETILRVCELGNAVILGRGANIITAKLPHVVHVRLIASLERRIKHMQYFEKLSYKDAAARIHAEDLGRERYVRKYFHVDVADPQFYHLTINTDLVSFDDAARMIGDLALNRKLVTA